MSAVETGLYQPAQLLSWVYMSLQDAPGSAFNGFEIESDTPARDGTERIAADLSSNYLGNFFHLNTEVQYEAIKMIYTWIFYHLHNFSNFFFKKQGKK